MSDIVGDPRDEWCDLLVSKLEPGARVLELGCGPGDPKLAPFDVTSVDFLELELPDSSYDACVSFSVFNPPNFFSSYPPEGNVSVERDEVVTFQEPEGDAPFQWILARR